MQPKAGAMQSNLPKHLADGVCDQVMQRPLEATESTEELLKSSPPNHRRHLRAQRWLVERLPSSGVRGELGARPPHLRA